MQNHHDGLSFRDFTSRMHSLKTESDVDHLHHAIQQLRNYQTKFPIFQNEIFFIIDYTRQRHILMTGNVEEISGYQPEDFLENGLAMVMEIFQKDDFSVYNKHVYASIDRLFKNQCQKEHGNFIFEFNYRMQSKDRRNVSILQRSSYVTDPSTLKPLFSYGTCMDISAYKNGDTIVQKISRYHPDSPVPKVEELSVDYFYPDPAGAILTKREKEMLKWVSQGLSTKQIASKFHLSLNTVMNHRKSMLKKTNAKNVAELIHFAITHHII